MTRANYIGSPQFYDLNQACVATGNWAGGSLATWDRKNHEEAQEAGARFRS